MVRILLTKEPCLAVAREATAEPTLRSRAPVAPRNARDIAPDATLPPTARTERVPPGDRNSPASTLDAERALG